MTVSKAEPRPVAPVARRGRGRLRRVLAILAAVLVGLPLLGAG